jgi:hypothetical protein
MGTKKSAAELIQLLERETHKRLGEKLEKE